MNSLLFYLIINLKYTFVFTEKQLVFVRNETNKKKNKVS